MLFPVIYIYIVGKIIQIVKHCETEGDLRSSSDHQDQSKVDGRNEQPVENKQRGMVGAKSGADDQSVPPAGREWEASQNEQQTEQSAQLSPQSFTEIIDNSTLEHSGTVGQSKQPVPVEQSGMVSQDQQGEMSGADDQASRNKQQTEQSGEAAKESSQHNYMYLLDPPQTMYKFLKTAPSRTSQIL